MRRNGDRKSLGTASAVLKRLRDDGSERSIASSDDDLPGRIDIGSVDGRLSSPDLLDEVSDTDFVKAVNEGKTIAAGESGLH